MKSKLGMFSNTNKLMCEFKFTHKELQLAASLDAKPLVLLEKVEGKNTLQQVYAIGNSTTGATLSKHGAAFPFAGEADKKVSIAFPVTGDDEQVVRFNAAQHVQRLEIIEKQVLSTLNTMKDTASKIATFTFEGAK